MNSEPRYEVRCAGCGWPVPVWRDKPVVRYCAACTRQEGSW